MRSFHYSVILSVIAVMLSSSAFGQSLHPTGLGHWDYQLIPTDAVQERLFTGNADAVLTLAGNDDSNFSVFVYHFKKPSHFPELDGGLRGWQELLISRYASRQLAISEQHTVEISKGHFRYIVQFTYNGGNKELSYAAVMAEVIGRQVYWLKFENAEPVYRAGIDKALQLFEQIRLTRQK